MQDIKPQYVGFWMRFVAFIIDTIAVALLIMPILIAVYGRSYLDLPAGRIAGGVDFLLSWVFPPVATMAFLLYRKATPGKMLIGAIVVDATTFSTLSRKQVLLRYVGYIVGSMLLGVGLLWVAFDKRKQGLHDKIAHSVVVKKPRPSANELTYIALQ